MQRGACSLPMTIDRQAKKLRRLVASRPAHGSVRGFIDRLLIMSSYRTMPTRFDPSI